MIKKGLSLNSPSSTYCKDTGMRNTLQKIKSKAGTIYITGRHWSWGAGVALFWCASAQAVTPPIVAITAPATSVTRTTDFTYYADGSLKAEIREPDNAQLKLETGYQYDAWGNRIETTVSSPATGSAAIVTTKSSDTYDARGQFPVTQKNALGHASTTAYDARYGTVSRIDDANQLAMQVEYDGFGRKVLEISPDGTRRKWAYSLCDASCEVGASYFIKVSTYASDGVTQSAPLQTTYFDALDREIKTETYGFDITLMIYTKKEYDSRGNLARSTRPYFVNFTPQWTSYAYDELNRLVSSTAPDGAITSYAYDGLRSTTTNALNQTTTKVLNAKGQLAQVTDNLNQAIGYQYDALSKLWLTTDPKNNMNVMAYDVLGRKIKMYEPDTGGTLYDYDVLGRLVRQTDARGNVTEHVYDVLNRLRIRTEVDMVSRWDFDDCTKGIGKLCRIAADNGYQDVLAYDASGRLRSGNTTIDATYTSSKTFDELGRVVTQTYPTGLTLEYEYQGFIYLKEIRNKATGALYWRAKEMDAEGRMREQLYGNQIVSNAVYNEANGAIKEQYAGAGKGVQNLVYDFDKIGNLQSRSDSNQNLSETFLYDGLNRLTTATVNSGSAGLVTQSYAYDGIGNIKQRSGVGTYSYLETSNKPHAVSVITLEAGGKRYYTYDVAGNLVTELQTSAAGATIAAKGRTVSYTSFNMPLTIATPSASMTFVYGPQHQRIKEIAPGLTTIYLNGNGSGNLLYEKDIRGNGEVEHRQFISANGVVVAVVKTVSGQNTTQYFHRDYLGSVVAISDEAGTVIERFAYEASGKRRFPAGSQDQQDTLVGVNTKRGFTNHAHLDTLGLVHMNGRIYDPLVARFMSADPGVPHPDDLQSYNRYSYARNNPLMYVDLNGFEDHRNEGLAEDTFPQKLWNALLDFLSGYSDSATNQSGSKKNEPQVTVTGQESENVIVVTAKRFSKCDSFNCISRVMGDRSVVRRTENLVQGIRLSPPTQVYIGYTPLANGSTRMGHHTFLMVTSGDRAPFYIRGGPSANGGLGVMTADQFGSVDRTKDAGYGSIKVRIGEDARIIDESDQLYQQYVGELSITGKEAAEMLTSYATMINNSQIPYIPTSQNSNAITNGSIQALGLPTPDREALAPGFETPLKPSNRN